MIKASVLVMVEFSDDWERRVTAFYEDLRKSGLDVNDVYLEVADESCEPIYELARKYDLRVVISY